MSVALVTKGRIVPVRVVNEGGISQVIHGIEISVSNIGLDLVVVGSSQLDLSVVAQGINITVDAHDIDVNAVDIKEGITII